MSKRIYKYYTVYVTTNLINNKIYVGIHRTNNLNDGYIGSGQSIKAAKKKYGISNMRTEIINIFDNEEDMWRLESEIVNEIFISRDDVYNKVTGGRHNGSEHIKSTIEKLRDSRKKQLDSYSNEEIKAIYDKSSKTRKGWSDEYREQWKIKRNKTISENQDKEKERRRKISETLLKRTDKEKEEWVEKVRKSRTKEVEDRRKRKEKETKDNWSVQKRNEYLKKLSDASKRMHSNRTEEEKKRISSKILDTKRRNGTL